MSKVLESYSFTIEGRPRPKERPRHTIGYLPKLAAIVYNIFARNPRISMGEFTKKFIATVGQFTKNAGTTVFTPVATQEYEQLVHYTAMKTFGNKKITDKMLNVEIKLYFADKKIGDVDNYTKSILDGLHSIMDDDKQVKKNIVEKFITIDEEGNKIKKEEQRAEIIIDVLDIPVYYTKKKK